MTVNPYLTPGHRVSVPVSANEAELYKLGDKRERTGTVIQLSDEGTRAQVRWDDDPAPEHAVWQNVKSLKIISPPPNPFCSYCLGKFKPGDPVVLNPGNGVAIHVPCAGVIAGTLAKMKEHG